MNRKKTASEIKFVKNRNEKDSRSPLLIKKQKIRDLWKEKFISWNDGDNSFNKKVDKNKLQGELKFPNINITKI